MTHLSEVRSRWATETWASRRYLDVSLLEENKEGTAKAA